MATERRVVVTGIGVISPIGNSVDEFWTSLINGKSGIGTITKFDASDLKTRIAGEVKNFNPEPIIDAKELRRIDLFSQYALCSAAEGLTRSGLSLENEDPFRVGVIFGSGIGGINVLEKQIEIFLAQGPSRISPFYITGMITDICAGHIAMKYGLMGPNYVTTSACASSSHAIGDAFHAIKRSDADIIVAGGTEGAISPTSLAGFINIKALSRRNDDPQKAARPFDIDRDGFIMSEGSATLILEELEHAEKRGADILAEISGVGYTADGYHITAPHPEGIGAAKAIELSIVNSGKEKDDVDYINCHAPSTPAGDKAETMAIKYLFGDKAHDLSVSSTKSMHGHLLGAAGALEAAVTVLAIKNNIVPPTINVENQDPECDLNCTPNKAVEKEVNFALTNSFGFGGHNVTLAFKKYKN
ncbi:beta-ketoacyl-ACP synthase II [Candidatus Latescibacterota bacterium]